MFLARGFYFAKLQVPLCGCPAMRAVSLLSRVRLLPQSTDWPAHDGLSRVIQCPPQRHGGFYFAKPGLDDAACCMHMCYALHAAVARRAAGEQGRNRGDQGWGSCWQ